jgi:uncharacterized protein (TIGR02453 family)
MKVPMSQSHFTPELFKFLRELKQNNNRHWFLANKERYEKTVRNPFLDFIGELGPPLRKISRHLWVDSSPTGGSMFRIYRDARFSKDKSPYKTHVAARFPISQNRDVHSPGYYLHLEPLEVFGGGGIWRPEPPVLSLIRDFLAHHPRRWKEVFSDRKLKRLCVFDGEKLQRPPKGYDPNHELIEFLKYKDFFFYTQFNEKQACSAGFLGRVVESCEAASPFMEFLAHALHLQW